MNRPTMTRIARPWALALLAASMIAAPSAPGQTPKVPSKSLPEVGSPGSTATSNEPVVTKTAAIATTPPKETKPAPAYGKPGLYAGIEVGSKGVKSIVMEVGSSGASAPMMERISNPTLGGGIDKDGLFSRAAIEDTAEATGQFAAEIRDKYHVPDANVVVFGSSGLPAAKNRGDLVEAVKAATHLAPMTFITPPEEVKLMIKGSLVDEKDRAVGMTVDVGSGNTKGGFMRPGGVVVNFVVPLGSKSFTDKAQADADATKRTFAESASALRPTLVESEIAKQIKAYPELAERDTIFLSGGAAYALVSLLMPEAAAQDPVILTARDIAAYNALVHANPIAVPTLDDPKDAAAKKEIKNVLETFTPTNLIAGSEILSALSSTLDFEHKKLIRFNRKSIMDLVRGKVLELAE